jgi:RNase H-fold protein (predicted Holliday junction resolvase)
VDYGRKIVGLAVSTMGLAPRPVAGVPGVPFNEVLQLAASILAVAQQEACDAIVVGVPVTRQGSLQDRNTDSQQGRRCRNFAGNLATIAASADVPVFLADEQGSTVMAMHSLTSSGSKRSTHDKVRSRQSR